MIICSIFGNLTLFIKIKEKRDQIGLKPIKDIITSLIGGWPLTKIGQFDEKKFDWRDVMPKIMPLLPRAWHFYISVRPHNFSDPTDKRKMLDVRVNKALKKSIPNDSKREIS